MPLFFGSRTKLSRSHLTRSHLPDSPDPMEEDERTEVLRAMLTVAENELRAKVRRHRQHKWLVASA